MNYYDDAQYSVENFIKRKNLLFDDPDGSILDEMVHRFYKNYYSYDMDEEYALLAAISEALESNGMEVEGFEKWIP